MSESFQALKRANPRAGEGFAGIVEVAADAVRARVDAVPSAPALDGGTVRPRRRRMRVATAGMAVAALALAAFFVVGSLEGPGVESASAAFEKAATLTAASAERSGTAVIRIAHNGELWAGKTVRWNGADVAIAEDTPGRQGRPGGELRVVDGIFYGPDADGGWLSMGSPSNIDPDSGTTPDEHLAAVREDIGGVTLRRIARAMAGPTTGRLEDGSTVYRGNVAAGLIARETGFKEGQAIRVLPFGYVAHDEAANPAAPLDVAVTVGADGIFRAIVVTWGTSASAWRYTVTYSDLGATAAPVAPANARSLLKDRLVPGAPPGS